MIRRFKSWLRKAPARQGEYEWNPVRDQVARRLKGVRVPEGDRERILAFMESREGVEAYVEPKTVVSPLSVVLVAKDGEWRRFQLGEDMMLRELAAAKGIRVFDASRIGYPERMRRYRPPPPTPDDQVEPERPT
jgi:hypothetical protein